MIDLIKQVAEEIKEAKSVVALTGAGISVESGIPPFRGKGGIWEKIDPMEFAHINSFMKNPAKVWEILIREMKGIIDTAKPNYGHIGLARLEEMGLLSTVITQNVDGLHQVAGNTDVIEFHGTFAEQRCLACDNRISTSNVDVTILPPRCECGGILRPDCIFFGEMIPQEAMMRSQEAVATSKIMLVIGTSAVVQPSAYMPVIARESGAKVYEINPEPTPLTGVTSHGLMKGNAGNVMKMLTDEVEKIL